MILLPIWLVIPVLVLVVFGALKLMKLFLFR
jgi:hypothetical protein